MQYWRYNKTEIVFKSEVKQDKIQKFINKLIIKEKEDNFKELYDLIKWKNINIELPDQIIEEIKDSKNYIDYLENLSILASMEFDKEDYDFVNIWDNYIYENKIDHDLKELMKFQNKDLDDYISFILKKHTLKQETENEKNLT